MEVFQCLIGKVNVASATGRQFWPGLSAGAYTLPSSHSLQKSTGNVHGITLIPLGAAVQNKYFHSLSSLICINLNKMPPERLYLFHRVLRFLRLPVAQVNERGNRRGVGKGKHRGIITAQEFLVHHTRKDMGEYFRKARQKMSINRLAENFS